MALCIDKHDNYTVEVFLSSSSSSSSFWLQMTQTHTHSPPSGLSMGFLTSWAIAKDIHLKALLLQGSDLVKI